MVGCLLCVVGLVLPYSPVGIGLGLVAATSPALLAVPSTGTVGDAVPAIGFVADTAVGDEARLREVRVQLNPIDPNFTSEDFADLTDGTSDGGVELWLDAVLSVEDVQVFKPARRVYDMVHNRFGTQPEQVLFVSSNGWDAAAASAYGFQTAWVNRAGDPMDRLPAKPRHVLTDLTSIPDLAKTL